MTPIRSLPVSGALMFAMISLFLPASLAEVAIHEIHYHPADKTLPLEFIELHHHGDHPIDLSGWRLREAVTFTLPQGTRLEPGGFLVIAQAPAALGQVFGVEAVLGPWEGKLSNEGEEIILENAHGNVVDRVEYGATFPWPVIGGDLGSSIELAHPDLENHLGGHWHSQADSLPGENGPALVPANGSWRYWKGLAAPEGRRTSWMKPSFDDSAWPPGQAPLGYGEAFLNTTLEDMQGRYTTVYFRKTFEVVSPLPSGEWQLRVLADDGAVIYLNGLPLARVNMEANFPGARETARKRGDVHAYQTVPLLRRPLVLPGTNVLSAHVANSSLDDSSDFYFDAQLLVTGGASVPAAATPGTSRRAWQSAEAHPPAIQRVRHQPHRPPPNTPVEITAEVSDPQGVQEVTLEHQVVVPGDYFSVASDPSRYGSAVSWSTLPMITDGESSTYRVALPADLQRHRHLIRYRVRARDALGHASQAPRATDPEPNFAYFVYGTLPSWTGRFDAHAREVTYDGDTLTHTVPVYHLLAKAEDVQESQHGGYRGSDYRWHGTLIVDGEVYDPVGFRARGGVWRYHRGKNFWKFNFPRSHRLQARDAWGHPYPERWDKLNFSSCYQNTSSRNRHQGEQGLYEAVSFALFNKAGVEAPHTHYVHFRIIDTVEERGSSQWEGDFHGLYLAIEQVDGRFLDAHDLPDGNLYKMEHDEGAKKNQGPTHPRDDSDLAQFQAGYRRFAPPTWWREHLNLEKYFSYRSIVEAVHHYDIAQGKNYYYYHHPQTGRWEVHPWDVDLTWDNRHYGNGDHLFSLAVAQHREFRPDYASRLQEIQDLLYNPEQTGLLIDEWLGFIHDPAGPDLAEADAALWNHHPEVQFPGAFYTLPPQFGLPADISGFATQMKAYVASRQTFLSRITQADASRWPDPPSVRYLGPEGYPKDALSFTLESPTRPQDQPQTVAFRLAEITLSDSPQFNPEHRRRYEIDALWEEELDGKKAPLSVTIPAQHLFPKKTYRVRARVKSESGAWSRWSEPHTFTATHAKSAPSARHRLAVTELMYHPDSTLALSSSDEYVILKNLGEDPLDLTALRFEEGIRFRFANADRALLHPRQTFLLASASSSNDLRTKADGRFQGKLDNGGERLRIVDNQGRIIVDFPYDDEAPWPLEADGRGASLQCIDPHGDPNDPWTWQARHPDAP